jgi:hypothetical protein
MLFLNLLALAEMKALDNATAAFQRSQAKA